MNVWFCFQLYKAALGNCFETEEWGPIEYCIMAKHFERQGKGPYAYHAVSYLVLLDYRPVFQLNSLDNDICYLEFMVIYM